jgi:hypothetical protein
MRRVLVAFFTLFLLWVLVTQLNHELSGLHLYLFIGGLFVTYAALVLRLREGLIVAVLAGLLCDASMPIAVGTSRLGFAFAHTHTILFAIAHTIIVHLRDRIPRDETTARVLVALFTNLAIYLLVSFTQIGHSPSPNTAWPRIVADLFFSQIFLVLIAPWFFALQAHAFALVRADREPAT